MERLDNWRAMDRAALKSEIWPDDVPANADRWTIVKPDIAATTETVISFTTSQRPKITVTPKNTVRIPDGDAANQVERLGYAIHDTIERDRDTPLDREIADHTFHRGAAITMVLRLTPEERGAEIDTIEPVPYDDPDLMDDAEPLEVVVSEERYPLLNKPLDPYECFWMMAPDGRLVEFAHQYDDSVDNVLATFPGLEDHPDFSDLSSSWDSNSKVTVTDYWTEKEHCILINARFFKTPTPHEYPCIPVVVDLAAPRTRRYNDRGAYAREGTPFCGNMLDAVSKLSMAESWAAANLEEVAFPVLTLEGVDPNDSPHMQQDEKDPRISVFKMDVAMGPTKEIVPLFRSPNGAIERLKYVEPPPAAAALMQFAAARLRDSALVAFPESMMMGAGDPAVSGYAYAQMKHGVYSKTAPYFACINRHLSRVIDLNFKLLVHDWDRAPEVGLQLVQMVGQQQQAEETIEVSKETLQAVGNVKVEIQPDMPVDLEKEWTMLFQATAQGLMSKRTAMNKMGVVEDPTVEFEDTIAEMFAANDPNAMAGILARWMQRNGYKTPPSAPQPPAPVAPALPAAAAAAPAGAMPPADPGMAPQLPPEAMAMMQGGAPMGADPMAAAGGQQIPPEILMMLQQQGAI